MSGSLDRSSCPAELALFPTAGCWTDPHRVRITIAGIARRQYAPTISKRLLIKMLGSVMGVDPEELANPLFMERVLPFVSDGASREPIVCELAGQKFCLKRTTKSNGFFNQTLQLTLPAATCQLAQETAQPWQIPVRIARPQIGAEYLGHVYVYRPQGVSIVSDIDDTIKESDIGDRQSMLVNTFLREFRAVPQIADVYREWALKGADFHYVSSSPWQLLAPLNLWLQQEQFPLGSVHLRPFRLRNHMLQRMVRIRRTQKARVIRSLIRSLPARKFLLIGDSGERDLQIYGKLARKFPQRVSAVLIRNLSHQPVDAKLLAKLEKRCPQVKWQVFETVEQLRTLAQDILPANSQRSLQAGSQDSLNDNSE